MLQADEPRNTKPFASGEDVADYDDEKIGDNSDEADSFSMDWREESSWMAAMADMDPSARQVPTLFPYEINPGFSVQASSTQERRLSGSTIVTTTTDNKIGLAKRRESMSVPLQALALLDRLHQKHLQLPRPTPIKRHLAYENDNNQIGDDSGLVETRQKLMKLEAKLRRLEQRWMEPGPPLDSRARTMRELEVARLNQQIAGLAVTIDDYKPRAAQALKDCLCTLKSARSSETTTCEIASICLELGNIQNDIGEYDEAIRNFSDDVVILQNSHVRTNPQEDPTDCTIFDCHIGMGRALLNSCSHGCNHNQCITSGDSSSDSSKAEKAYEHLEQAWNTLKWYGAGAPQSNSNEANPNGVSSDVALYLLGHAQLLRSHQIRKDEKMRRLLLQEALTHWKFSLQYRNKETPLDQDGILITSRYIATAYIGLNEYEHAMPYLEDCLQIANNLLMEEEEVQRSELVKTYIVIGDCYICQDGKQDQALQSYQEALSLVQEAERRDTVDKMVTLDVMVALGDFYCRAGQEAQALYYYQAVSSSLSPAFYGHVTYKTAVLLFRQADMLSAVALFEKFEQVPGSTAESYFVSLLSSGACHDAEGNKKEAKDKYYSAILVANHNHLFEEKDSAAKTALEYLESSVKRPSFGKAVLLGKSGRKLQTALIPAPLKLTKTSSAPSKNSITVGFGFGLAVYPTRSISS